MATIAVDDVDALDSLADVDDSLCEVDVLPSEGAHLADAHAGREAYQYAEVAEVEVLTHISEQTLLVCDGQYINFAFVLHGGKLDVPFFVREVM